jgi:hypothetical protein
MTPGSVGTAAPSAPGAEARATPPVGIDKKSGNFTALFSPVELIATIIHARRPFVKSLFPQTANFQKSKKNSLEFFPQHLAIRRKM